MLRARFSCSRDQSRVPRRDFLSVILNDKADAVRCAGKLDRTGRGTAVPFGIGQCFLHRSDQSRMKRQRDHRRITADRKIGCDSRIFVKVFCQLFQRFD